MKFKLPVYIALVSLLLVCWVGYYFIFESKQALYFTNHRVVKHIVNFAWLFIMTAIGYFGLKFLEPAWPKQIWLATHLLVILFLLIVGLIDLVFSPFTLNIVTGFAYLRYFFQSPLPYIITLMLSIVDLQNVIQEKKSTK